MLALLCRSGVGRLTTSSAGSRLCRHQHHVPRKKAPDASAASSWNGRAVLGGGLVSLATVIGAASVSLQDAKAEKEDDDDQLPLRYDAEKVKRYWDKRPVQVFMRSVEVRN